MCVLGFNECCKVERWLLWSLLLLKFPFPLLVSVFCVYFACVRVFVLFGSMYTSLQRKCRFQYPCNVSQSMCARIVNASLSPRISCLKKRTIILIGICAHHFIHIRICISLTLNLIITLNHSPGIEMHNYSRIHTLVLIFTHKSQG